MIVRNPLPDATTVPPELWDEEGTTLWVPYFRYPSSKLRSKLRYDAFTGRGFMAAMSDMVDRLVDLHVSVCWMVEDKSRHFDDPFWWQQKWEPGAVKFWKVTSE